MTDPEEGLTPAELMRRDMEQKRIFEAWQRDLDWWDEPPARLSLGARMRRELDKP